MKMSDLFRRYRENCGLSQSQVAKILNVDRSTYTYYETGKTQPSINTVIKIAKIFNVPYMEFFKSAEIENFYDPAVSDFFKKGMNISQEEREVLAATERTKIYELSYEEQLLLLRFRFLSDEEKADLFDEIQLKIDKKKKGI